MRPEGAAAIVFREALLLSDPSDSEQQGPTEREITGLVAELRAGDFGTAFQTARDTDANSQLASTRDTSTRLAQALGITAPAFEEFFARGHAESPTACASSPELVPVLAPHGLGLRAWQRVAEHSDGQLLPHIECASEVRRWFGAIDQAPPAKLSTVIAREPHGQVTWTLRWISAAPNAENRGQPYRPHDAPTLPELLMLQARQQRLGLPYVDRTSFTWLAGALPDSALRVRHTFDSFSDTIRFSTRSAADRGMHVGFRATC